MKFNKFVGGFLGILLAATGATQVWAHGESIRGDGSGSINTVGASILEESVLSLRWDARRYETFTNQQMVDFKAQGEDVHQHESEDAYFLSYAFPINEDMDMAIMVQYNNFKGFKDNGDDNANACFDPGNTGSATNLSPSCISPTASSPGFGDTLIVGRYRFFNDGDNQLATIFGVILPTGKITNTTDGDELIGTHNQPGSGALTFHGGVGYSGHLTENVAIDADLIYRFGTQGAKRFRSGNSWQFDVAASYQDLGKFIPVIELNGIFFQRDIENDLIKKNSGGDVIYASPGLSYKINDKQGLYANFSYPIMQELKGISNDEKFRWSFGWATAL